MIIPKTPANICPANGLNYSSAINHFSLMLRVFFWCFKLKDPTNHSELPLHLWWNTYTNHGVIPINSWLTHVHSLKIMAIHLPESTSLLGCWCILSAVQGVALQLWMAPRIPWKNMGNISTSMGHLWKIVGKYGGFSSYTWINMDYNPIN